MLYPFTFQPRFKERVWGGRNLERLFAKPLPAGKPIGESWEITDRPDDVSVIANGPLAGRDLRWLMEQHGTAMLGAARPLNGRFPLLIKLLDAQEKLSLQVHPPAHRAAELKGEPKTEMWFIAAAEPGAELYVGLRPGVTRAEFEQRIRDGTVADCFHRISVKAGDTMFLPSGRVHAIGAGLVIFEIQQNSDTTYRVFDWNRVGLDGQPRELHIAQSLASIDFADLAPGLVATPFTDHNGIRTRLLVSDPLFTVHEIVMSKGAIRPMPAGQMQIIACYRGQLAIQSEHEPVLLSAGQFCLAPAALNGFDVVAHADCAWLQTFAG